MIDGRFCQRCGFPATSENSGSDHYITENRTIHLRRGGRIVVQGENVNLFINKRKVKRNKPVVFQLTGLTGVRVRRRVNWAVFALGAFFVMITIILITSQLTSGNATPTSAGIATTGPALMAAGFRRRAITLHYTAGQTHQYKSYNNPLLRNLASAIHSEVPAAVVQMK